ncbi:SusC/RagA family TonB-linked outer membrane protein, partial [Pedobacter sp.]
NSAEIASRDLVNYIGWNPFNVSNDEIVYTDGTLNPNARLLYPEDTGYSDDLKRLGVRTDLGMTYSAGSQKSDQYFSLGYLDEKGYTVGSDFKRLTGRLRVNTSPTKWLKVGLNVSANFTKSDVANQTSGINENPFYVDLILAPIYPVYKHDPYTGAYLLDANGKKIYDPGDYKPVFSGRNVVYETEANINNQRRNSFTAVNTIDAKITKTLKFTSNFSAYINNYRGETYDNSTIGDAVTIGKTIRTNSNQYYLNWSKILSWTKRFDKHRVTLMAGHENYYNYWDQIRGTGTGEAIDGLPVLDNMTSTRGESYDRLYTTEGFLSKADYSYNGIYVLSGSFRRDGSSRFAKHNRWGNFWSVSGAYNISKEKFFKVNWVNSLKVRGSYGLVGNDKTGNFFTSRKLYTLGYNNGYEGGAYLTQSGNPNLKWETNRSIDVAVEAALFKNRLRATVELFRRQSDNLLFDVALPLTSGLYTMDENFGSMKNEGIEIELGGTPISNKNFVWYISMNATKFNNVILALPDSYKGLVSGTKRYDVGVSRYGFWLRDWIGVDPNTGGYLYAAENGATTSSGANAVYKYFGSPIPDWYGGVTNTFSHKNLSLRVLVTYQIGGYTYDEDYQRLTNLGTYGRAMHVDMLTRWQKPGDITQVGRLRTGTSSYYSDRMLMPADYINIRTVALTYNFTKRLARKIGVGNAKAYINGENLFISSKRKGLDPTQTYTGVASYTYAPSRIVSLGLNLTL